MTFTFAHRSRRRASALVAVGLTVLLAGTAAALPATAATPPPSANRVGGFTDLVWDEENPYILRGFTTETGFNGAVAQDGYRVVGIADGGAVQEILSPNTVHYSEGSGTAGSSIRVGLTSGWGRVVDTVGIGGEFQVYVEHIPGGAVSGESPDGTVAINPTSPYFSETFVVTDAGVQVKAGGTPTKTATSTALASSEVTQTSVKLTATIDKTEASGTVQFKNGATDVGAPVPVASGKADYTVTGLTAGTNYTFTAAYSGDVAYEASAGTVTVKTAGPPTPGGDNSSTPIDVNVPAVGGPSGLKISVPQGSVLLAGGGTRASGETWTATGRIDDVTVNDDRRSAGGAAWTLNGKVSAFASGTNSIAGSSLGWAPEKITGPGVAGAAVVAGDGNGLSVDRPLATGSASASSNVETKVKAALTLKVPAAAPAGAYSGTLTLTLI